MNLRTDSKECARAVYNTLSMIVSMTICAAGIFKYQLPVQFGYALMVSYAIFCLLAVTVVEGWVGSPRYYECTTWGVFDAGTC